MTPLLRIAVVSAAVVVLGSGCATTLYYGVRQTRTYEYERRTPVLVTAYPDGATIVDERGRELGVAPLVVDSTVRVRREHRYCSGCMALVGCAIDVAVMFVALENANDDPDSALAVAGGVGGTLMGLGCASLGIVKLINRLALATARSEQNRSFLSSRPVDREVVIPRTVELRARWDGLGEARSRVALPGTRTVVLRLPRRYTFDEALLLWARATPPAGSPGELMALGEAQLRLARSGGPRAAGHAAAYFALYLERYPGGDRAPDARRGLDEARRLMAAAP
jgi:hypothetical protein